MARQRALQGRFFVGAALSTPEVQSAIAKGLRFLDFLDADGAEKETLSGLVRQGAKAAVELSRRLEAEGPFRILLSFEADVPTATLRFFERRDGEAWGAEDPGAFQREEILMIDTGV